jgi:hypothetical protein
MAQQLSPEILQGLNRVLDITVLDTFQPNAGGQDRLFRTKAHEVIALGGNSSGKTFCLMVKAGFKVVPAYDMYGKKTEYTIDPFHKVRIPKEGSEVWISSWSEKVQISNIEPVYERVLGPYEKNKKVESGARLWSEFEGGRIVFKWQTRGIQDYRGAKENLILLDEPHSPAIYNECKMRLGTKNGTIIYGLTPIADPQAAGSDVADIVWLHENIVEPYLENRNDFSDREVIFMKMEENRGHVKVEQMKERMKGMSPEERNIRETGYYVHYAGNTFFDPQMLADIAAYLKRHPEESTPQYGYLTYDDTERDEFKVVFKETRPDFPEKPEGEFIIKIWEHPIDRNSMYITPEYFIGGDAAEGSVGGDYSAAYVMKGTTGEVVAAIHGHLSEIEFARQLYLLGMYYCRPDYRPAMLAVETSNVGKTTVSYLVTGHTKLNIPKYGIDRLYHRPKPSDIDRGISITGQVPGWYTSQGTRPHLLTAMRRALVTCWEAIQHEEPPTIPDLWLVEEARRFVRTKNKFQATPGVSKDDRLFALAIAEKCREQYYHIPHEDIQAFDNADESLAYFDDKGNMLWNSERLYNQVMQRRHVKDGKLDRIKLMTGGYDARRQREVRRAVSESGR